MSKKRKAIAVGEHQTLKTLLPRTKPFFFAPRTWHYCLSVHPMSERLDHARSVAIVFSRGALGLQSKNKTVEDTER
jgi:hypothetical protein